MKTATWKVLGAAAVSAGLMLAQGPGFGFRGGGHFGAGPGQMMGRMSTVLNLDDAQKTKATAIFDAARQSAEAIQPSLTEAHNALREAVKANAGNIDALAANLGTLIGQMQAIHAKAAAQFRAILTAEQQQQFDARHGGGFGPGGHGHRAGHMGRMGGAATPNPQP